MFSVEGSIKLTTGFVIILAKFLPPLKMCGVGGDRGRKRRYSFQTERKKKKKLDERIRIHSRKLYKLLNRKGNNKRIRGQVNRYTMPYILEREILKLGSKEPLVVHLLTTSFLIKSNKSFALRERKALSSHRKNTLKP